MWSFETYHSIAVEAFLGNSVIFWDIIMYVCVCMYINIYIQNIYIYIYIYIHTYTYIYIYIKYV